MPSSSHAATLTPELFAQINGLSFRNSGLLLQALTHRSYLNENAGDDLVDNERLEFLGDAVLDFVTGEMLFHRYPDWKEGDLTRMRAALVRTESLAEIGRACRIGEALRMGRGEERNGGRKRINNVCGAFEAVIGALYVDQGLEAVRDFALPRLLTRLEQVLQKALDRDARSDLQERTQALFNLTPQYRTVNLTGPDHEREFTVEVMVGTQVVGIGTGHSKQAASMAAAKSALTTLDRADFVLKPDDLSQTL